MNGKFTKSLIWAAVLAVLALEIAMFLRRSNNRSLEAHLDDSSAKSAAVSTASTRKVADSGVSSVAATPAAPTVTESAAAADPLSLDALARRVQPAGARANEVLLSFKTPEAYAAFLKRLGGGLVLKDSLDELLTARVGFDSLEHLRAELQNRSADNAEISANYMVAVPRIPPPDNREAGGNVPFGDTVLSAIGVTAGVNRSEWGSGVTVAVVDSGVGEHPTFRADQVTHVDLVGDGKPFDGHGTAMASLIAGSMNGAEGVAPGVNILDVRVAGGGGDSDSFMLARGITTALSQGAKVINVSMGSYGDAPVVQAAVKKAVDQGAIIVASAGNEEASTMAWPAAYPGVVSVSGVDAKGQLAYFSNTGNPTLAAPAVGIPSAFLMDNKPYNAVGSGTSQAAALVSGAVAVIMSHGGNVPLTLNRNAVPAQAPAQAVGAGIVRLPSYR